MARLLPPLNALRAFEAAARHLSFARAAEELHVTPAAISHQVKALEQFVDAPLFHRLPRGLELTEHGRAYLPDLRRGFDQFARATERVLSRDVSGRLVVSVLPSFALRWLTPRIADFRRRHQDVDVVVWSDTRAHDLFSGDIGEQPMDVCLRYGAGGYADVFSELVLTEQVTPVCAPSLLNGPLPLRTPSDLKHHTLIHDADADPQAYKQWLSWKHWFDELGVTDVDPYRGLSFSDANAEILAALEGHGVALGRTALVADFLTSGRLVRPFDLSRPARFSYYFVCTHAKAELPNVRAFLSWIREQAAESAAADLVPAKGEWRG